MKRTPLGRQSKKRAIQYIAELKIRAELCKRAGGIWNGHFCSGGICEECHNSPDGRGLRPHEKVFRSRGGRLSMENSKMLCGVCHSKEHGIKEVNNVRDKG